MRYPSDVPPRDALAVRPLVVLGFVSALLFLGAFALRVAWLPVVPGFDDAEHLRAAVAWQQTGRLTTDGPFIRVPLWPALLGTLSHVFRPGTAVLVVQLVSVFVTLGLAIAFSRRVSAQRPLPLAAVAVPVLLFATSPQLFLYAAHAVNELWIGMLAAVVLFLGTMRERRGIGALGAACGAAAMTKLSMGFLSVPALWFSWPGEPRRRAARLARLGLGAALVVVPLVVLHAVQRPGLPLDNTSAFTLGEYTPQEWLALGDPRERREAALANFWGNLAGNPTGYARDAVHRLGRWITRPASADFALYVPGFPKRAVGIWESSVLGILLVLAVLGTTRHTAPIWIFVAAIPLLCAFPVHVPFTPKIIPIFPCVLLAPLGLARLSALGKGEGDQ